MSGSRKGVEESLLITQLVPGGLTYIAFFNSETENFIFTNYYSKGPVLKVGDYTYKTPEHYFQAQKFPVDSEGHQFVVAASTPGEARVGQRKFRLSPEEIKKWDESGSYEAMLNVIRQRVQQDALFKQKLIETGTHYILEDTYQAPRGSDRPDAKWGGGADGQGENLLGKALMQVRSEIMGEKFDFDALREKARAERKCFSQKGVPFRTFATTLGAPQSRPSVSSAPQLSQAPDLRDPFAGKEKPTQFICKILESKVDGLIDVYLTKDNADRSKGVLKCKFSSPQHASAMENLLQQQNKIFVVRSDEWIIMSLEGHDGLSPKAEEVLKAFGITVYGLKHPQPIIQELKKQWHYEQKALAASATAAVQARRDEESQEVKSQEILRKIQEYILETDWEVREGTKKKEEMPVISDGRITKIVPAHVKQQWDFILRAEGGYMSFSGALNEVKKIAIDATKFSFASFFFRDKQTKAYYELFNSAHEKEFESKFGK